MVKYKLAYFKLPPELLEYIKRPNNPFFPANLAQKIYFNSDDYDFCSKLSIRPIKKLDNLIDLKHSFNKVLSRDLFRYYFKEKSRIIKKRIYASYNWGCQMKKKGYCVIAWNMNEVESIALSYSGVNIIWLENGYSRGKSYYYNSNFDFDFNQNIKLKNNITYDHQNNSLFYNILDIIFNIRDRYGVLGYYLQILNKNFKKKTKEPDASSNLSKIVFLAQLDYDYNTLISGNGYDYDSGLSYLNNLVERLNKKMIKYEGYVRLHPNCSIYYNRVLSNYPKIKVDKCNGMDDCVKHYDIALTINSSASTSFINSFKQVLFLGSGEFVNNIDSINQKNIFLKIKSFCKKEASIKKLKLDNYIKSNHVLKKDVKKFIFSNQ